MKELKIRMQPTICSHLIRAANSCNINNEQLKELIISEIKIHLIAIMYPNKTEDELIQLSKKFSQIKHSPNNSTERKNWVNSYGVFYKVLIPEELYKPKVYFHDFEIEE